MLRLYICGVRLVEIAEITGEEITDAVEDVFLSNTLIIA